MSVTELAKPQGERMANILFQSALPGHDQRISLNQKEAAMILAEAWRAGYEAAQREFDEALIALQSRQAQ